MADRSASGPALQDAVVDAPADAPADDRTGEVCPPAGRRRWTRAAIAAGKGLLFAVVLLFVAWAFLRRFERIEWSALTFRWEFMALAGAYDVAALALSGILYRMLLRRMGQSIAFPTVLAMTWMSRLGKYVPGKLGSMVGAMWLLRRRNIPAPVSGSMIVFYQSLMVMTGLVLAVPLTIWTPVRAVLPLAWLWCGLLLAVGAVFLHPRIFFPLCSRLLRRVGLGPLQADPRARRYVPVVALTVAVQVLGGVKLWAVGSALTDIPVVWIPVLISAGALAGTAGFLAFFSPAGLGVRELVLLPILGRVLWNPGYAAVAVVAARLVQVVVEVAMALAGVAILKHPFRRNRRG